MQVKNVSGLATPESTRKSGSSLTIVRPLASNLNFRGLRKNEEVGLYQWFSDVASEPRGVALGPPSGLYRII